MSLIRLISPFTLVLISTTCLKLLMSGVWENGGWSMVLTSASWLLARVNRVTGLPGVLLSLTGVIWPLRMTGIVPSAWPGCGWAWPASLVPRVRYCLTCWAWAWWRWYLEFSRWFWTWELRGNVQYYTLYFQEKESNRKTGNRKQVIVILREASYILI